METPDPPNDTPGALKQVDQVVLTPHDIPWSLRVYHFMILFTIFVWVLGRRFIYRCKKLPEENWMPVTSSIEDMWTSWVGKTL